MGDGAFNVEALRRYRDCTGFSDITPAAHGEPNVMETGLIWDLEGELPTSRPRFLSNDCTRYFK